MKNEVKEVECEGKTVFNLLQEIAKLKAERDYWMDNYSILHNKITNEEHISLKDSSLEDLELTENFLNNNAQDLGYDPDEMEKAYAEMSKDYNI